MKSQKPVYQVSELTDEMRRLMESSYPEIWIEGELSSLSTPASGHLYFSLKDERSQLRCAMFKGRASVNRYKPKAGDLVRVRAKISVYTARGDLQCIVQHIEEAGEGLLQKRFEELKQALNTQGLFDQKYKSAIPKFPRHVGVVTSASGAAVRDVLTTLERRCSGTPITVYPCVVQGESAAQSIMQAIRDAVQHSKADVLILTRGGGSLEDLWCFNNDKLAQLIFDCPIPLVSGVGHEVDVTIADLVADVRAPTPTAAAELVSPDTDQLNAQLNSLAFRLPRAQQRFVEKLGQNVDVLGKQLKHPKHALQLKQNDVLALSQRLLRGTTQSLKWQKYSLDSTTKQLQNLTPKHKISLGKDKLKSLSQRVKRARDHTFERKVNALNGLGAQLNSISPLATLERGFSITRSASGQIMRDSRSLQTGDSVTVQLGRGELDCEVVDTR